MKTELARIGVVHNGIRSMGRFKPENVISEIEIYPEYTDGLEGLDSFSHIVVVFWLHKIRKNERTLLKVHPRGDPSLPLTGVFATRSPARPNPIGITVVKQIKRTGNVITVSGLDSIDGTPLLDIKPHIPEDFPSAEIRIPARAKQSHK